MRRLFLPVIVVAVGTLAALPFRRSSENSQSGAGNNLVDSAITSETSATQAPHDFPTTVAPLRVAGGSGEDVANSFLAGLRPTTAAEQTLNQPAMEMLPESYDQIAVPLADRDTAKNLLKKSTPDQSPHSLSGNNWTFDRFGIPRPTAEAQQYAYQQIPVASVGDFGGSGSNVPFEGVAGSQATGSQWSVPSPIVDTTPQALVLASDLKRNQEEIAERRQVEVVGESRNAGTTREVSNLFQAAKSSQPSRQSGQSSLSGDQKAVREPEARKRYWVHEPVNRRQEGLE